MNNLFIEQWSFGFVAANYFRQCAPLTCTLYIYTSEYDSQYYHDYHRGFGWSQHGTSYH